MLKRNLVDFAKGGLAFGLGVGVAIVPGIQSDPRKFVSAFALVFLIVAFWGKNSERSNPWLRGVLVGLGGVSCAAFALNWRGHPARLILLLVCVLASIAGVQARCLWDSRHRTWALIVMLAPVALSATLAFFLTLPAYRYIKKPAPVFSISIANGKYITSPELRGHVVVLAFWATWCAPCIRSELPKLESVYKSLHGNPDVVFFGVVFGDSRDRAETFAEREKLSLPLAYDTNKAGASLGVDGPPRVFVMDKAGNIRLDVAGGDESEGLETRLPALISDLLKEDSPN